MSIRVPRVVEDTNVGLQPNETFHSNVEPSNAAPLGDAVEAFGDQLDKTFQEAFDRGVDTDVTNGLLAYEKRRTMRLYDDKTGALNQLGEDALGADERVRADFEKDRSEISSTLRTDEARKRFIEKTGFRLEADSRILEKHVFKQQRVADLTTLDSLKKKYLDNLGHEHDTPEARDVAVADIDARITKLTPVKAAREQAIADWHMTYHTKTIENYLKEKNIEGAEAYYANVQGELGRARPDIRKAIDDAKLAKVSQDLSEYFVESTRDPINGAANKAAALTDLQGRDIPQHIKDEITKRLDWYFDNVEHPQQDDRKAGVFDKVLGDYRLKGYKGWDPQDEHWLKRYAPRLWDDFQNRLRNDRNDAQSQQDRRERKSAKPKSPDQIQAKLEFLDDMMRNPDKYSKDKYNPSHLAAEWYNSLTSDDYEDAGEILIKRQSKMGVSNGYDYKAFARKAQDLMWKYNIKDKDNQKRFLAMAGAWFDEQSEEPTSEAILEASKKWAGEVSINWARDKKSYEMNFEDYNNEIDGFTEPKGVEAYEKSLQSMPSEPAPPPPSVDPNKNFFEKADALKALHPDWTDEQIYNAVVKGTP